MAEDRIRNHLVKQGEALFHAPRKETQFAFDADADRLLNELETYPHAFLIACLMDRQIKAESAWSIPHKLSQMLGGFDFVRLQTLTEADVLILMSKPKPLHRIWREMSGNLHAAIRLISEKYGADASRIWKGNPSSAEVVYRFLEFRGIGPKIATMAANILARDFKIPMSDYYSIDVSADVHIRRVFARLGLIGKNASVEEIVYKARSLNPDFPGILDFTVWEIGRNWCRPSNPLCCKCDMQEHCPKIGVNDS